MLSQGFLFVLLYLVVVVFVAAAAVWLRRRIPSGWLAVFAAVPLLLLAPGIFSRQTLVPVDHAMMMNPWSTKAGAGPYNPYLSDVALQFLPWTRAVRLAWGGDALPLRDLWNGCGMPLAGNGQSAAFSPLTLLAMPLPLAAGFTLAAAVKLFLALAGMWLWLTELRVSRASSFFGAVAFAFSFSVVPWLFAPQTAVLCLWPWFLFLLEALRDSKTERRAFWMLALVLSLLPLGGHIESAAWGVFFAALSLGLRGLARDMPDAPRVAGRVAMAGLVALGATAFSLVPQVFAILSSNRMFLVQKPFWSAYFSWWPHRPVWPQAVLTTIFPRALGDAIASPVLPGAPAAFTEMALGYIGIVGWAAALLLLRPGSKRRRISLVLIGLAFLAFAAATAIWPFAEIVGHLPLLKFIFPPKLLSWVAIAISAVAALEVDRLCRDLEGSRRPAFFAVGTAVVLALAILLISVHFRPAHTALGGLATQRHALWLSEAALASFAACVGLAAASKGRQKLAVALPLCLAVVGGGELLVQGARLYRYGQADRLFPPTPLTDFLRDRPRPFRVVGEGAVLFPNSNVFAGVEDVRTHDPVERRDYVEFLDATCGYPPAKYFKSIADVNAPALDFLNVRYLISTPERNPPGEKWVLVYGGADGTVFENRDALPRVFAPRGVMVVRTAQSSFATFRNALSAFAPILPALVATRDWREKSYVLGNLAGQAGNVPAEVTEYEESVNSASFRVLTPESASAVVLVTSLVQDGGWSARERGGGKLPTTLANGPFLALRVPAGDRRILLKYSLPGFSAGAWISLLTLLAAGAFTLRSRASLHPERKIASGK